MSATDEQNIGPAPDAFHFGRNWQRYLDRHLDADREYIAKESLRELVGDVRAKTFLDIGCGSGLFSLSAFRAGAKEVVSFDVDPDSVAATLRLRDRAGAPEAWRVIQGSILDASFLQTIRPADVVYSWGALHHTGDMYAAIGNAAACTNPGGILAIAIYNRISGRWMDSHRWWQVKRAYNRAPRVAQIFMQFAYSVYWNIASLSKGRNPVRYAREYRKARGMALWTDHVDWLGGYPYEFASASEIIQFCKSQCGLDCLKVSSVSERDNGNNEFVFVRPES